MEAERGAQPLLDVLEEEKILAQLYFRDFVRRLVVMLGELTHGVHVQPLSALGHAATLQVCDHAATQFGGGTEFVLGWLGRNGMPRLGKT
jgi:hypothetical protein